MRVDLAKITRSPFFGPALIIVLLCLLFGRSFLPGYVHFSNDGPLGQQSAAWTSLPAGIFGVWNDLNHTGYGTGAFPLDITCLLKSFLGPVGFSKFFAPISLAILGVGAWAFFRAMKLSPVACAAGAVAAALNSAFFSEACWGVASHAIAFGMVFMALALVQGMTEEMSWPLRLTRLVLAGLCVGMNVMEAADIGALFSVFVAGFVCFKVLVNGGGSVMKRLGRGVLSVAIVALFAAFIAAQALSTLVSTQIVGIAGTSQDSRTKAEKWNWATQFSLPKKEALDLVVPGLFGYRMDTPGGGQYWGQVGRSPGWEENKSNPNFGARYRGSGFYAGAVVCLLAVWTLFQAVQRRRSLYSELERKWIGFWLATLVVSLLLGFGRFAPFYQIVYALPYFSTIRNPTKFLFFAEFALVTLAAVGVEGICRAGSVKTSVPVGARGGDAPFRRGWGTFSLVAPAVALLGWLLYAQWRPALERYVQTQGFSAGDAAAIAQFSIGQVGWFWVLLSVGVALIWFAMRGRLLAAGFNWGGLLVCGLLVVDLGRANLPWIVYWNYPDKYAANPVIDFLRTKPYEHRVAALPFRSPPQLSLLDQIYRIEWMQQHFPYYNIQSLDIVQMPREPVDLKAFESTLQFLGTEESLPMVTRRWELTNTRYLLGPAGFLDVLNSQLDPVKKRFRYALRFDVTPKPGVLEPTQAQDFTAVANTNGAYAIFDFTGALPRVKLYADWQVMTNDQAALARLASPEFDPGQSVLVDTPLVAPGSTNDAAGSVDFVSYANKHIVLKANAKVPAVLLLNDHYDPGWSVTVDGKPVTMLRCNYLMRGVYLSAGEHTVDFSFRFPTGTLYVTAAGLGLGIILVGVLITAERRRKAAPSGPKSTSFAPKTSSVG